MRGTRARWAVALRIARRGALTSWGRSLLIVALIAAPIVGLAAAAVVLPSRLASQQEQVQDGLGSAQARLTVVGGPKDGVRQALLGGYDYRTADSTETEDETRIDPRSLLPAGTRVLRIGSGSATFALGTGAISLSVETGPTWDPSLAGGPYALLSGQRPTASDEILLSPSALVRLRTTVGGTVRMTAPTSRTLHVVGTARNRGLPSSVQTVFGAQSLLPDAGAKPDAFTDYVPSTPIDWATVQRLNAAGTTALSRAVVLDPPAGVQATFSNGGAVGPTIALIAVALVFAVLEVALLAGAAFLVGARLQQRMLATIASIGAERGVLRRVVTANGVVLGTIGGVVGVGLGIASAVVVMRITDDGASTTYPGLHLWWPLLAGIAAFGVLVGWIAALVPARAASRFDVVRALRGARTPQRVGRRPVIGVVVLSAGVGCSLLGGVALAAVLRLSGDTLLPTLGAVALLGGGSVLAQVGVLLCAGLVLRGVARLVGGSLAARLAARDTARNLGRAVPAVASVMTTVFVAAFVMCVANSTSLQSAAQHYWSAPDVGGGVVQIVAASDTGSPTDAEAAEWMRMVRADLPVAAAAVVAQSQQGTDDPKPSNRLRDAVPVVRFGERAPCTTRERRDPADRRCGRFAASSDYGPSAQTFVTVGDPAALALLLGHSPSRAAQTALADGGAVALRSDLAPGGRATLDWFTPKQLATGSQFTSKPRKVTRVAAAVDLPDNPLSDAVFVTPATAGRLGLDAAPAEVLLSFTRPPTQGQIDTTNAALGALVNQPDGSYLTIEEGPQDYGSQIAWLILLACLVIAISAGATAIGLARVDGRADDLTLASLGAAPRIRKTVAFVQALIICGVGAVVGTVLGLLPAVALGTATASLPFAPPVLQLALTAIGIPIVIAAGAWILVGTRGADLSRRAAIA